VDPHHHRKRPVDPAELLRDSAVAALRQALAAVLLRYVEPEQPTLAEPVDDLVAHPALGLDLAGVVGLAGERLQRVDEVADVVLLVAVDRRERKDEVLVDLAEEQRLAEGGDLLLRGVSLGGGSAHCQPRFARCFAVLGASETTAAAPTGPAEMPAGDSSETRVGVRPGHDHVRGSDTPPG
jgi:hypothetical protein